MILHDPVRDFVIVIDVHVVMRYLFCFVLFCC